MISNVDQFNSIYSAFHKNMKACPNKCAVIFEGTELSYEELNLKTLNLCEHLSSKGLKPGDAISVILPNSYEYSIILLAASKLKLLVVPFNIGLPVHSILANYKSLKIKYSFVWHGLIDDVLNLDKKLKHSIISIGNTKSSSICNFHDIELSKKDFSESIEDNDDNGDAPYIICMTSGSTGNPKPIVLSQKTKLKRIQALKENYGIDSEDICLTATPLYHSLAMRLVLQALVLGGTSVILKCFSVEKWRSAIRQQQISFTIAVSSQLKQIAEHLQSNNDDFKSLRVLVSSSEQLNVFVKQKLIHSLGCEFHECYGTSEIGIATNLHIRVQENVHSVGKAINGVDIVILDNNLNPVANNIIGEIACRTHMRFSEYLGQAETTQQAFHNDYFLTGDLGYLDDDGYLYYKGRKKELIISGGINIYPKDIEDTIKQIVGVKEVAVIAKPDNKLGEVVSAVIVKDGSSELSIKTIKQHCAKHLADFQYPREFHFINELPKNSLGKIQKHKLFAESMAAIA